MTPAAPRRSARCHNLVPGLAGWLAAVLAVAGCGPSRPPPAPPRTELVVFAAASAGDALEQIKAGFEKQSDMPVRINVGSSAALAAQIAQGAEADLFLSASEEWAADLNARHLVVHRRNLLGNALVLVVPADSRLAISGPADLLAPDVAHVALADPETVPAGKYAKAALTALGLWDKLKDKIVPGGDVRQTLVYVERGEAEAGIVYATDAAASSGVKNVHTFDPVLTRPILYSLMAIKTRQFNPVARSFFDYLGSPAATEIFEKHGFWVLPDESRGGAGR